MNPLLDDWYSVKTRSQEATAACDYMRSVRIEHEGRDTAVDKYSWAIPNETALVALARVAPLVEIGAGTGYWAHMLGERGVDVIAFDRDPVSTKQNHWHRKNRVSWFSVQEGTAEIAGRYPDRTLFLCWPPYDEPMASLALKSYTGKRVAYIGEGYGGCTADDEFHEMLGRDWNEIQEIDIPQWYGLHDHLWVYERKAR